MTACGASGHESLVIVSVDTEEDNWNPTRNGITIENILGRKTNPDYYDIIKAFEDVTGYGVVVNTSFNVGGEPIVCTPEDAHRCFMRTRID